MVSIQQHCAMKEQDELSRVLTRYVSTLGAIKG